MTPATFTISAHSLGIYDRCSRAYLHYKVHGRKAVRAQGGLLAGSALHAAIHVLQSGGSVREQEQAITDVLTAAPPLPPDDHRTPGYLRDALAAFRAEFTELFRGWTIEEQETQGTVRLGSVERLTDVVISGVRFGELVEVFWEFRRDLVGVSPSGERLVVDWKTASRDEDAQYLAYKNSGQFMGYVWSWNQQHPGKPCAGVLPVRIILRRPTKSGVSFAFPHDPPIVFEFERLDEWRRHTLAKVQSILERNPDDPDAWPLAAAELGCCRHTYGVCDYLAVCTLPPAQRMRMLMSDAYEPADSDKPKSLAELLPGTPAGYTAGGMASLTHPQPTPPTTP